MSGIGGILVAELVKESTGWPWWRPSSWLDRTRFGRYMYATGGNAEAARRAGVRLATVRTLAFMLASFTAGIAGIVYASRLRSVSTALDSGTHVLYAVAAAVVGGTSLFGDGARPSTPCSAAW